MQPPIIRASPIVRAVLGTTASTPVVKNWHVCDRRGHESIWNATGEKFWIIFRLYGPEPRLFDRACKTKEVVTQSDRTRRSKTNRPLGP